MAAYFHCNPLEISTGSDGGLQTLVVMNPTTYFQYPDDHQNPQPRNNSLVFLNSHALPLQPPRPPPSTSQQFVGIPLSRHESDANNISVHGFIPCVHYNLYNPQANPTQQTSCETPRFQRGPSLTLLSQQQQSLGFKSGEEIRVGTASTGSGVANRVSGLLSSKYLKAARELLDEVFDVNSCNNNGIINNGEVLLSKKGSQSNNVTGESLAGDRYGSVDGEAVGGEAVAGKHAQLTAAERQEIQFKIARLVSLLDEADQRYRQYHHQMQIVISSFEQAAGDGSATTYTSLALKTISKQFRCLKDAIMCQIGAANKSLGEEDSSSGWKIEGSRLKFVHRHLRQKRALQRYGMIQHHSNAWRFQRGLPQGAVLVLRAWLFEHFLHPYPKDSDKHMLAKQTGLTRSQVSNWFINARVRVWKPMVEEMYVDETKEQEKNGSLDKTEQSYEDSASKSTSNQRKGPVTENRQLNNHMAYISMSKAASTSSVGGIVIGSSELDAITTQGSPKRLRSDDEIMQSPQSTVQLINMDFNMNQKLGIRMLDERQNRYGYSFMESHTNVMENFGQYPIGEIPRFDAEQQFTPKFSGNNGVSLTLGLPYCENISGTHQSFLPSQSIQLGRRVKMGEPNEFDGLNTSSTPHSSSPYDSINIQNQRRFVAQLLPDFVA